MLRGLCAFVLLLGIVSAVAACGARDGDVGPAPATRTAANGDEFNGADVEFAADMIQHHAQALSMVDLTVSRDLDPEVQALAEDVREAQGPEIEQLTGWLTDWDEPVPETVRDHANAHGEGEPEMDSDMPGMMSSQEIADLEAAEGARFERLWLAMMTEHHEGAIEMARTEQTEGTFGPAVQLAETIESAQQAEISTMESLLASSAQTE